MEYPLKELAGIVLGVEAATFLGFAELPGGGVSVISADGKKFILTAETLGEARKELQAQAAVKPAPPGLRRRKTR